MPNAQTAVCPKCGFSYGWDGNRCRHCKLGVEDSSQDKFVSLAELQEVLSRPEPAPDELVADVFGRFRPCYSVLWSAGFALGAAGLVCHLRPQLARQVLVRPIEVLFDLGARSADHVLCWADSLLEVRREALADCTESIVDPPRALLAGFTWFHPTGMNPNVCLKALFEDMMRASGPEGVGVEWLKANLPQYREVIQTILDGLAGRRALQA